MPKVQITLEVADAGAIGKIKEFSRAVHDSFGTIKAGDPVLKSATIGIRTLTDAKGVARMATTNWSSALSILPGQLGAVASQATHLASVLRGAGGLSGGMAAVAGGMAAVAIGGVALAKSLADDIEHFKNLSLQTGLSVAALQAFEEAAKRAGESPESLAMGFGKVNQAISDFLAGKDEAAKGFEAIGVPFGKLVLDGAGVEDILEAVAKALAAIPDPTKRAAAQMDLFGMRGRAMSTVLAEISKQGIGGYIQSMKEAGVVTSDETNKMAEKFDLMLDDMMTAARAFLIELKAFAAGVILAITESGKQASLAVEAQIQATTKQLQAARPSLAVEADIIARGGSLEAQAPPHELARPGVADVLASRTPRVRAQTAAEIAEAKAAAALQLKQFIESQEAMKKEREELRAALSGIDDRERAQRLESEESTRKALAAIWMQSVDDYEERQEQRNQIDQEQRAARLERAKEAELQIAAVMNAQQAEIDDAEVASTKERDAQILQFTRSTSAGRIEVLSAEREKLRNWLDEDLLGVQASEDAKLRIKQITAALDLERARRHADEMFQVDIDKVAGENRLAEMRIESVRRAQFEIIRHHRNAAMESGDAWGVFTAGFKQQVLGWGTDLEQFERVGAAVATDLHQAFSDSFFSAMKGDLDDLDDAWKGFFDAVLRHMADFMAAQVVDDLMGLLGSLGSIDFSGVFGSASSAVERPPPQDSESTADTLAAVGSVASIISTIFAAEGQTQTRSLALAQRRLGIEEEIVHAAGNAAASAAVGATSAKSVETSVAAAATSAKSVETSTAAAAKSSFSIAGAIQGGVKGAGLGAVLGPAGMALGGLVGAMVGGFGLIGMAVTAVKDALVGTATAFDNELSPAAVSVAAAAMNAATKQNGLAESLDGYRTTTESLTNATTDLQKGTFDLLNAEEAATESLGKATEGLTATTEGLGAFSDGLEGFGEGMAAAVEAAGAAAEAAAGAADRAATEAANAQDNNRGSTAPSDTFSGGGGVDTGAGEGGGGGDTAPGLGGDSPFQRGGIVTGGARRAVLHGPEAVIPLNARGRDFVQQTFGGGDDRLLAAVLRQNEILESMLRRSGLIPRGAVTA